jgi:hypothetical protein
MLRIMAAACLLATWAPATTFSNATTADLVSKAERVCCARCDAIETRRDPRTGLIFTHVRLRLLEDIKGRSGDATIRLRIVGGRLGNEETIVAGMPRFKKGGESVLLLGKANRAGYPVVLEARRGVLHLRRGEKGGRYLAERVTGLKELEGRRRVALDDFRGAVVRLAQAKRAESK